MRAPKTAAVMAPPTCRLVLDTPLEVPTQDHSQRGLLLEVRADAPAAQVLNVMCTMTASLCDF
jgi:hypothetical protein